jgi:hypothetical protein
MPQSCPTAPTAVSRPDPYRQAEAGMTAPLGLLGATRAILGVALRAGRNAHERSTDLNYASNLGGDTPFLLVDILKRPLQGRRSAAPRAGRPEGSQ